MTAYSRTELLRSPYSSLCMLAGISMDDAIRLGYSKAHIIELILIPND